MTDDDAGGGGKNGDFWMTSFVNDPLLRNPANTITSVSHGHYVLWST